jgi:hypothetical protein
MILLRFDVEIMQILFSRSVHLNMFLNKFELVLCIYMDETYLFPLYILLPCAYKTLWIFVHVEYFTELLILVWILELRLQILLY